MLQTRAPRLSLPPLSSELPDHRESTGAWRQPVKHSKASFYKRFSEHEPKTQSTTTQLANVTSFSIWKVPSVTQKQPLAVFTVRKLRRVTLRFVGQIIWFRQNWESHVNTAVFSYMFQKVFSHDHNKPFMWLALRKLCMDTIHWSRMIIGK